MQPAHDSAGSISAWPPWILGVRTDQFGELRQRGAGLLSNGLLRIVAILALIAAGFGWLTGRVNTGALVTVIIGIAIIFSAPWIVDQLQG